MTVTSNHPRRISSATTVLYTLLWLMAFSWQPAQAEFDTRAHTDLGQVIMLCATEPGSPRFASAWKDWLVRNPGADVAGAVETVVSRAGTVRSMAVPGMTPTARGQRPDPEAITELMFSLAGLPVPR